MQKDFSKQLIKGKIAELVFEQMFRDAEKYTVIPFGYESVVSELQQYTRQINDRELLDNIRNAPDFALVSHDPKEVFLVEVKYRSRLDSDEIRRTAAAICERWKLAYMFIATPEAFYFDRCSDLLNEEASLTEIPDSLISRELQDKYRSLLVEFIKS
ncbi:MAG TPA: hypothetical protein PK609_00250 [Candidatus Paceibacterota bacterium]|nr:hypothetical protein [Candidatus Paceibacterota bacterium]